MSGIPTIYNSVRFRSRLEAKWVWMFDRFKWDWQYEPFDLSGYIPDFVVNDTLLIEIKPTIGDDWWSEAATKIRKSGWTTNAVVFGSKITRSLYEHTTLSPGIALDDDAKYNYRREWEVGFCACVQCANSERGTISIFKAYGHAWSDGYECLKCGYWHSDHLPDDIVDTVIPGLWKKAANTVQWHPSP